MLNKIYGDISICAQLSGHGEVMNHKELDTALINDINGHPRQVILDKSIDAAVDSVGSAINRICSAFYTKENNKFWNDRIIAFEYIYNVDWYILLSYLFMVDEDDRDKKGRELRTACNASAILCKIDISKVLNNEDYLKAIAEVSEKENNNNKEYTSDLHLIMS